MSSFIDCRGKRIAIVGNAGSLLSANYGTEIDACDVVVRFNVAWPRTEHDAYIGTRTDVAVIVPQSNQKHRMCEYFANTLEQYKQANINSNHAPMDHVLWTQPQCKWKAKYGDPFTSVNIQFTHTIEAIDKACSPNPPSSGISAVGWFLMERANLGWSELLVYGWDFFASYDWQHGPDSGSPEGPHSSEKERGWFLRQVDLGNLIWRKANE